jgi:hypothetical protein
MKFAEVRRLALSLPEVIEEPHFAYTSFRVKGKIFATSPPGGVYLHVFVADEDRERALTVHPEFLEKLLWGGKVRGLRVVVGKAKTPVVAQLLRRAWSRKAPKKLWQTRQAPHSRAR